MNGTSMDRSDGRDKDTHIEKRRELPVEPNNEVTETNCCTVAPVRVEYPLSEPSDLNQDDSRRNQQKGT